MRKGTAFAQMIVADHICMIFRMSGMGPIVDLIDDDLHVRSSTDSGCLSAYSASQLRARSCRRVCVPMVLASAKKPYSDTIAAISREDPKKREEGDSA